MEALANQMHGLEDEARLSVQGILPSLHTVSSHGGLASPGSTSSSEMATVPDVLKIKEVSSVKMPSLYSSGRDFCDGDSGGGYDSDDEDDKFFDAPEISLADWDKAKDTDQPSSPNPVGHRRSFSTTSVNDSSSMKCVSDSDVKKKLPQVSSDRRMAVSC